MADPILLALKERKAKQGMLRAHESTRSTGTIQETATLEKAPPIPIIFVVTGAENISKLATSVLKDKPSYVQHRTEAVRLTKWFFLMISNNAEFGELLFNMFSGCWEIKATSMQRRRNIN